MAAAPPPPRSPSPDDAIDPAAPAPRSPSPDDALDIFSDSLVSLFDHHVPAHGHPRQLYTYTPPPPSSLPPITVRLPPQAVNSLFAHHVWNSELRMADVLATGELRVEGEDVLELGAGAGISGLMAARVGASRVVLSDYDDPSLVANLRSNIALAFPSPADAALRARVSAHGHSWGDSSTLAALLTTATTGAQPAEPQPFTRILLADTLWFSSGHTLLLDSLAHLLARTPNARACFVAGFHSGRATVRSFLRKAAARGFVRRGAWEEVGVDGRRRKWGWDVRGEDGQEGEWDEAEDGSERNKWVVEGQLGWSDDELRDSARDAESGRIET
ncbi:hypothetical protein JCM3770_003776 [Rhodotorula araucariae]